jgi:hypothetical protein
MAQAADAREASVADWLPLIRAEYLESPGLHLPRQAFSGERGLLPTCKRTVEVDGDRWLP